MSIIEIEYKGQSKTFQTEEMFNDFLKENNLEVNNDGNITQEIGRGVIPELLKRWFQQRQEMRKKAAEYKKAGDVEMYNFYNQRQQVWKILLNSFYGVLGLPIFRFYDVDNAEAVTTSGVDIIQTTAKAINIYYKQALDVEEGDWVIYSDTDSCFVDACPIIRKRHPEIDFNDDDAMTKAIMEVTTEVQTYVNQFYNIMAKRFFNLDSHTFDAKQEVISKTSIWLAKKRYAQWIIHKEGHLLDKPELEVKGIDVVRTSYPAAFRKFMEAFLRRMLAGADQAELDKMILDLKEEVKVIDVIDIAKNTSVKFVSKDGTKNFNPEGRKPFQIVKDSTAQCKAALHYNDLLNTWGIQKLCEPIRHGQKMKWVYLKNNPYGLDLMALKGDDTDADKILEFVNLYVDRTEMFNKELKSKMIEFYKVFNWEFPNSSMVISNQFFG